MTDKLLRTLNLHSSREEAAHSFARLMELKKFIDRRYPDNEENKPFFLSQERV